MPTTSLYPHDKVTHEPHEPTTCSMSVQRSAVKPEVRALGSEANNTVLLSPLFLRAWYSHPQDIVDYFPTNPQVKRTDPIGH